jgi:hypothetical protein
LDSIGFPLKMPRWLGPQVHAQSIGNQEHGGIADASLDAVVDHCFLGFMWRHSGSKSFGLTHEFRQELISKIAGEYLRILKPGGRIFFQSNDSQFGLTQDLKNRFNYVYLPSLFRGTDWQYARVNDVCKINIPKTAYRQVKAAEKQRSDTGETPLFWLKNTQGYPCQSSYSLILEAGGYSGRDFYIFTKKMPDLKW